MTKRLKLIISAFVLICLVAAFGLGAAYASSNYGTKSDPLVTKSYLDATVSKEIMNSVNSGISTAKGEVQAAVDKSISNYESRIKKVAEAVDSANKSSSGFVLVTLAKGQSLACDAGAELMLRTGSAVSVGSSSPLLMDTTEGVAIAGQGSAVNVNHMYVVSSSGSGVKAESDSALVLVRGGYTLR
ncbi:MAG: hypothetical protein IJG63_02705 [Oscillospiraceae bacterium]|nr:hypothetical protein [Oscillospiraceae bacterium]